MIETGEQLRAFIKDRGILKKGKAPEASAWNKLAGEIELLRIAHQYSAASAQEARKKLQQALETAFDALPHVLLSDAKLLKLAKGKDNEEGLHEAEMKKLINLTKAIMEFGLPQSRARPETIQALDRYNFFELREKPIMCIEFQVVPCTQPKGHARNSPKGWHNYGKGLADLFRETVRAANPDLDLQFLDHGPVAKFLEAIIPEISEEKPKDYTIARYFDPKRRKDNN